MRMFAFPDVCHMEDQCLVWYFNSMVAGFAILETCFKAQDLSHLDRENVCMEGLLDPVCSNLSKTGSDCAGLLQISNKVLLIMPLPIRAKATFISWSWIDH